MTRRRFHNTLLALVIVLTPIGFLMFTDDGKRITDNAILWLLGRDSIALNIGALDSGFGKDQILQVFDDIDWKCQDGVSALGNHLCAATIGSFNDLPASYVTMFFVNDRTSALKVGYQRAYHEQFIGQLIQQLGQPRNAEQAVQETSDASQVLEWDTGSGLVVLKKELNDNDEPVLLWIASGNPEAAS